MKEFVLNDGYASNRVGMSKVKPINYVLGGKDNECFICTSHAKNPNG